MIFRVILFISAILLFVFIVFMLLIETTSSIKKSNKKIKIRKNYYKYI